MRFTLPKLFFLLLCITFISCKKDEGDKKYCWQLMDAVGSYLHEECGKNEAQMDAEFASQCFYFRNGPNGCWLINGTEFVKDKPEDFIRVYMTKLRNTPSYTVQKVECDYCKWWFHRLKKTYKPNNTVSFSVVYNEYFCGDSLRALYDGREDIVKETADSLIVRQFDNNGVW